MYPKTQEVVYGTLPLPKGQGKGIDYSWKNPLPEFNKMPADWYKSFNITVQTNPWYKDLSTWLWIGGIFGSVGLLFVGYKNFN